MPRMHWQHKDNVVSCMWVEAPAGPYTEYRVNDGASTTNFQGSQHRPGLVPGEADGGTGECLAAAA
jgi:hypothetical protein